MLTPEQFRLLRARQLSARGFIQTSRPKGMTMIHLLRLRFADPAEPNKLSGIELADLQPISLDCVVKGQPAVLDVALTAHNAVDTHPALCTPGYWQDQVLGTADQLAAVIDDDTPELQSAAHFVTQTHASTIALRLRRVQPKPLAPPAGDQSPGDVPPAPQQQPQQPAQAPQRPVPPPAPRPAQPQVNNQHNQRR